MVRSDHRPFHLRVLVPFWVLRGLFFILNTGGLLVAIVMLAIERSRNDKNSTDWLHSVYADQDRIGVSLSTAYGIAIALCCVQLVVVLFCLGLEIACQVKMGHRTLTPRFFLWVNVIQTVIFTIAFAIGMVRKQGFGIAIAVGAYLLFFGLLVYSIVIFMRERRAPKSVETDNLMPQSHQSYNPHDSMQQPGFNVPKPEQPGYA